MTPKDILGVVAGLSLLMATRAWGYCATKLTSLRDDEEERDES